MNLKNIKQAIISFSCSDTHSIVLDRSGLVWVWSIDN